MATTRRPVKKVKVQEEVSPPASFAEQMSVALQLHRVEGSRRRWRFWAIVLLLSLSALLFFSCRSQNEPSAYVARINIEGMMLHDPYQDTVLHSIANDRHAKALHVFIDSPGGTMGAGLNYFYQLRAIADKKPVVVTMGTTAASAGFMAALAGDYVIASPGTLTGSVGVVLPLMDMRELAEKVGIKSDEIASGDMKTVTSPFTERGEKARKYLQDTVNEMEQMFLGLVKDRRPVDSKTLLHIADGRILTGQNAHKLKLVDALSHQTTARKWLAGTHNIAEKLPEVTIPLKRKRNVIETLTEASAHLPDLLKIRYNGGALSLMSAW